MSIQGTNIGINGDNAKFYAGGIVGDGSISAQATNEIAFSSKNNIFVSSTKKVEIKNTLKDTGCIITLGDGSSDSDNKNLKLEAEHASSEAVYIHATNDEGGVKIQSGIGGFDLDSTGDIDIFSQGSNINIGVAPDGTSSENQTQSINIESLSNISIDTEDMTIVASDELNLISLTGNIQIGNGSDNPVIKFENNNLLINQTTSSLDRQVDVNVSDESSFKQGYNGIVVNTSNTKVAAEIELKTSDGKSSVSVGSHPSTSNNSIYQTYLAYQSGNVVVTLNGPEFTDADIGRTLYWNNTGRRDTISHLSNLVVGNSDTTNITVSGMYTGTTSRNYLIQIDDATNEPNTFRWSNDGGKTFEQEYVIIDYTSSNIATLDNGLSVQFASNIGFSIDQQMSFIAKITANVSISNSITTPETLYSLQPYHNYIKTETPTDLVISTNNSEKMRITGDGNISFKTQVPDAEFHFYSNYNRSLLVNEAVDGYQINPSISYLRSGGYVIVWESEGTDGSSYGVYGQRYMADGSKYGNNFKVNITTTNQQTNPHVACRNIKDSDNFIVAWADSSSGNYDIYAQIYQNGSPISSTDIVVNNGDTDQSRTQLYPRATGLTNGSYVVVWGSDDSSDGLDNYNIYAKIVDVNGNIGDIISVNTTTTLSQNFPYVASLSSRDPYVPGGFVVVFMNEFSTDDNRYNIVFRVFTADGTAYGNEVFVTSAGDIADSSISDGLVSAFGLPDGGFLLSFYRNYEADTTLYNLSDNITGLTSGAIGVLATKNNSTNTLTLNAVSGRFLEGEEIQITSSVPNVDTIIEKILTATFPTSTTATLVLDTKHKEVRGYRFNSNASSATDAVWSKRLNTKLMFEDAERALLSNNSQTRSSSIFTFRRPLTSVVASFDNDNAIFTWTNGSLSNAYYQIVNISDGSFLANTSEIQLGKEYRGLKQRNVMATNLMSIEGNDYGYVVVWDNTGTELNDTGIYHQLIGYNHNEIKFEDGEYSLTMNHSGRLGLGTQTPSSTLHIKSIEPRLYDDFDETATLTIQNTATNILTTDEQQTIQFQDGNGTTLSKIKSSYSPYYDDLNPSADNLIGFYKFDHSEGSRVLDSSSSSNIYATVTSIGILKNFDLEKCWQPGLINNCLSFNGINNYVFIHDDADNNINVLLSASSATFSLWVRIPSHVTTDAIYDIISNYDDATAITDLSGLFIVSLEDTSSNGELKLKTQVRSASATGTATGSTNIATNTWTLITIVIERDSSGTSNTITQYVNGSQDGTASFAGVISEGVGLDEQTVYLGSRNTSGNFFRGRMDEFRIYNTNLTSTQITQIYNYGSKSRGSLILSAKDDNSAFNVANSLILDHDGSIGNLKCKTAPFSIISGSITAFNSNTTIKGTNTLFTRDLSVGDALRIQNSDYPVVSIVDDTELKINQIPITVPDSINEQSILRKSSIISMISSAGNLRCYVSDVGNMVIGDQKIDTKFGISGTGDVNDLPYITLTNTTSENTDGGRETKLIFKGNNTGVYEDLATIEASHDGLGSDDKGKLTFYTNDDTGLINRLTIKNNGDIGIGNVSSPHANLHMKNINGAYKVLLESQSSPTDYEGIFSEKSEIYFGGETSINDDTTSLTANCLVSIQASGDSSTRNLDGRLDIYTNNDERDLGLEKRVSINSQGNVGVSIYQPNNLLQVSPELRVANFSLSTINGIASQTITIDDNLFSTSEIRNNLIGGSVIIENASHSRHTITAVPALNQVTVSGTLPGDTATTQIIHIYYPGLNVASDGKIGVGNQNPQSTLHISGSVSLPITTLDSNTELSDYHHTVICDTSSGTVQITLPVNSSSTNGRVYIVKRVGGNNATVVVSGGGNIDGSTPYTLSTNYDFVKVQSDGSNWYVIGKN